MILHYLHVHEKNLYRISFLYTIKLVYGFLICIKQTENETEDRKMKKMFAAILVLIMMVASTVIAEDAKTGVEDGVLTVAME